MDSHDDPADVSVKQGSVRDPSDSTAAQPTADSAESLGGGYEVIRERLVQQGRALAERIDALNERRHEVFGGTELEVIANERIRTDNNCVPRDILNVRGRLLFGYNVFVGLKSETKVADVFSLHRFEKLDDGSYDLGEVVEGSEDESTPDSADGVGAFLTDPGFVKDFQELYRYYDQTRLLRLEQGEARLFAVFQTGSTADETRIFRWKIQPDGALSYMDSRGDIEHSAPRPYDFEWVPVTRDDQVAGRHPHLSILDICFVETLGGTLTVKVENNTETGQGVFAEPVEDGNQTLDDGEFFYARLGGLILIKVLPFREDSWRYLVFNEREKTVARVDAIGQACRRLPEDHGIIFPGGYVLATGESKIFDAEREGLELSEVIRSPNGEDVLYVFHRADEGRYELLPYNIIRKESQPPIQCHGYSIFDDGRLLVFRALSDEPTRVHPAQVWKTPFFSAEYAAEAPTDASFLAKVGNADLVRGISEAYSIRRLIERGDPQRHTYEDLVRSAARLVDSFYWIRHEEVGLEALLAEIRATSELIIDEFEKVLAKRQRAEHALAEAVVTQRELIRTAETETIESVAGYMEMLTRLRHQRGHLITLLDIRYIATERLDEMGQEIAASFDAVSHRCVSFLLEGDAFGPVTSDIDACLAEAKKAATVSDLKAPLSRLEDVSVGLDLISEVAGGLEVEDVTARTRILESIGVVFASLNRTRATLSARRQELLQSEGQAEFSAQLNLLSQSVSSGLVLSDSPARTDEQLARLMVQLEELDARFAEFDGFANDIALKREEVYDAFSAKKQTLLDARQRRAENLNNAAVRILEGVARRSATLKEQDDLNTYFASDPMVVKLRHIVTQLRELDISVKADEIESRLLSARQDALRGLRDRLELFDGADLIKLGRHRFTVNTQPLDLALVPRDGGMSLHLTGTGFYERVVDREFQKTERFWEQSIASETAEVYRAEYLAASLLFEADGPGRGLSLADLHDAQRQPEGLLRLTKKAAAERYDEGYERGVHDVDAHRILEKMVLLRDSAGLLRYSQHARAAACLGWALLTETQRASWSRRAASEGRLRTVFLRPVASQGADLGEELAAVLHQVVKAKGVTVEAAVAEEAGRYLAKELETVPPRFVVSQDGARLRDLFLETLDRAGQRRLFEDDLIAMATDLPARVALVSGWLKAFVHNTDREDVARIGGRVQEAENLLLTPSIDRRASEALLSADVEGLIGRHPRISSGILRLELDEFYPRLERFASERVPAFQRYRETRHELLTTSRQRLRLEEYKPKVMSAFVRNRLINEVYLPLVGDNLAKQMGAAGNDKRTDLMGLLLLISPPGYGKTTLMEYVANRLGLVFMKINGPALGHNVTSLDPAEAPNATARQEVEKVNLALEMGNNVMLYVDDIQHTHPEFLQKFISLCDAQRRIEGVWKGKTRTYDLRGRKFCVVMAGNPYTESGDRFQIPDMLANRADVYNLGDILSGREEQFAMSYIENALSSNPVLAPLATRPQADVYRILRMAQGEDVPTGDLTHDYSSAELSEMTSVLKWLFHARDVLLKVNLQYIESASQEEAFRTEPPFKLQGSYRDINKLAEKIAAVMNIDEVERLIDDHYASESQTLTTGAEQNLLKLAELRGRLTDPQRERWTEIKSEYRRHKAMGGAEDDPVTRLTGTLSDLGRQIRGAFEYAVAENGKMARVQDEPNGGAELLHALGPQLERLERALVGLQNPTLNINVEAPAAAPAKPQRTSRASDEVSELVAEQLAVVEESLLPLVERASQDLEDSKEMHAHIIQLLQLMHRVEAELRSRPADK